MKLYGKSLCTSSIVAMLLIMSVMVPMVAEVAEAEINSTDTYFWVDPKENIVRSYCNTFTVNIMIANAPKTYAWEVTLEFDNNTLGVMSVTEGPWLSSGAGPNGTQWFPPDGAVANKTGTMYISCTLRGVAPGASGSGRLCTIVFHVESCGRSKLDLKDTALSDMNLVRTEYPNNDGFFCCNVECLHDLRITNVTKNVGAVVDQGATVKVNVTVHNEGNHNENFTVYVFADRVTHDPADQDKVMVGDENVPGMSSPQTYLGNLPTCNNRTLTFTWDTTNVAGENYTISANVTRIGGADDDPHDNVFIGPKVRVRCPHDLKILDATVLPGNIEGPNLIGVAQGLTLKINVTVLNQGNNDETFSIVVHAHGLIHNDSYDTTLSVTTALAKDKQRTYTVNWVTTGVTPDIYAISAKVTPVTDEKDTADNGPIDADEKVWVLIQDGALTEDHTTIFKETYRGFPVSCADISGGLNVTVKNEGTRHYSSFIYVVVEETEICIAVVQVAFNKSQKIWIWYPYGTLDTTGLEPGTYDISVSLAYTDKELDTLDNNVSVGTLNVRKWGDVNNDGYVTAADIVKIIKIISGDIPKPYYPPYMPDVNKDGYVTAADIVKVIKVINKTLKPIYPG